MTVSPVELQLKEEHRSKSKEEVSLLFDAEVESFSQFFEREVPTHKGGGPLNKSERMLIKTYLVQKIQGKV